MWKWFIASVLVIAFGIAPVQGQPDKPFILPVDGAPNPATWLFGQPYGNTIGAYNFGTAWYSAGQGLHFGIDIGMPCGTPLLAVGDGVVVAVDDLSFGAGPHNLLIRHPDVGVVSLYGHLQRPAPLTVSQNVVQGQIVGYSGDPDRTCDSRPHLHYEVRSLDYRTTYNPVDYINANWHSLAIVGSYSYPLFQGDMDNARRWMTLEDQPPVSFGGARLNAYAAAFPPAQNLRPAPNPPLMTETAPISETWQTRRVGFGSCCWQKWWSPVDPNTFYTIDGENGQRAAVFAWDAISGELESVVGSAPPSHTSPDGTYTLTRANGQTVITRLSDNTAYLVNTGEAMPSLSTDNTRLMWVATSGIAVPGATRPASQVWVSDIDGNNARQIFSEPGISAQWLDDSRLLIGVPGAQRLTTFSVYDTADDTQFTLGAWTWVRNLTVAPGGERLMFYTAYQPDPANSAIYTIQTQPDATAQRLDWFGGWRWRDSDSVYYIPSDITTADHTLRYYHIPTGEDRALTDPATLPFTVMNGDWGVSADGRRILFHNALDRNMWLLESVE